MNTNEMETTAKAPLAPGKGRVAADESLPPIEKRFKRIGISSSVEGNYSRKMEQTAVQEAGE